MTAALALLLLVLCLFASAIYSGTETGFYILSRLRVDLELERGQRSARIVRWLLQHDAALLVTLLVGNNLAHELISYFGAELLRSFEIGAQGLVIASTLVLTPIVFLFAEVLPKDLFRRRPYALVLFCGPFVALTRIVLWPLAQTIHLCMLGLARLFGLESRAVVSYHGREIVLGFLEEGRRAGILPAHAEVLAKNALKLRSIAISRVMLPWKSVTLLTRGSPEEELLRQVRQSAWTRLPVVDEGGVVLGYVHQIEVLTKDPAAGVLSSLRPLLELPPETSVDRALLKLRAAGARLALVGTPRAPVGLVALKDLVEEISGDIATW